MSDYDGKCARPEGHDVHFIHPDASVFDARRSPGLTAPRGAEDLLGCGELHAADAVVSQRGTMFSEPALTCAAPDAFARELLGLRFYSEATMRAHLAAT